MLVHFWGTRGSLPATVRKEQVAEKISRALRQAIAEGVSADGVDDFVARLPFDVAGSYGCNTSCVEIQGGTEPVLCDAGSGLRDYGTHAMRSGLKPPQTFHLFLSHLHWDHIHGFPFFVPAFLPGNTIHVYAGHARVEEALTRQQDPISFPLRLDQMGAKIHFHGLEPGQRIEVAGLQVSGIAQNHPGDSYGYRFEKDGRAVVYSTDSEHLAESDDPDYRFLDFFKDADLLIFDAQYNLADHFHTKATWGHSSNMMAVELAMRSGVKRLCLFHNEHTLDDAQLEKFLKDSRRYAELTDANSPLRIDLAHDGLEIEL
ncbi:MAG: MBL fold metallo-hydrolase [Vicinamibacteria bacterium]|nr:MBL fold metallo-hydrolase [Vicinamibacteria bacterium]